MTATDTSPNRTHNAFLPPGGAPWTLPLIAGGLCLVLAFSNLGVLMTVMALVLQAVFLAYFVRHMCFAIAALHAAPSDLGAPALDGSYRPQVSILVACKNEEAVVAGLVRSLRDLDYPNELKDVIVIDDGSTDATGERLDQSAAREPWLRVLHRAPGAGGGKSGALNAALEIAVGDVIVVFDADHQPHADVIRRLVRHFADPQVGAVQGRCVIRNAEDSPLTRLVAIDYLAGYLVNEYGRQCLFQMPAYGGANCAVRTASLRAVGGWNPHTVTEDTDLTMRLVLKGERVRFDVTAVDEEEGVVTLGRYWNQRYRWARGHQQVWRDYRAAVWRSPRLSLMEKVETTMFLLGFHVPVASSVGLGLLLLWGTGLARPADPFNTFVLWTLLFLGPLLELGAGLLVARADRREAFALALFLPIFFVSVALCTKAWFDAVVGRDYSWVKTKRSAEPAL